MFEKLFEDYQAQLKDAFAPVKQYSELTVANVEKLTKFQLDAVEYYVDLGLSQVKGALEITDPESLQKYVTEQAEVAKTVGEKITVDAKALASLGEEFGEEVRKITSEIVPNLTVVPTAAPVAKAPAKKAPVKKAAAKTA